MFRSNRSEDTSRGVIRGRIWVGLLNESAPSSDYFCMPFMKRGQGPSVPEAPDDHHLALEAVLRVSEIASSSASLPESVQAMVASAINLLGAEQGSIMLLEEGGRTLVLVAASGVPLAVPIGHRLPVGESVAGRVIATGVPVRLGEVPENAFVNFVPKARPIHSSVVVPLRVQGRPIGVLSLAISRNDPAFTDDDLRVAQMFADQAAGLLHRSRLLEQAERRSSDLMALVESSRGLVGTLDLDTLLQRILDGGSRLTGSKDGFACLFESETDALSSGVFRGFDRGIIKDLLRGPEIQAALANTDVQVFHRVGMGTLAAVGIRTTKATTGVLVLSADAELVAQRRELLDAYGQQCSSAIEAAELHAVVQRKEIELGSIITGLPNPIILVGPGHRIVAINPAAEELFGISMMFGNTSHVEGALGNQEVERLLLSEGDIQGEVLVGNPAQSYKVRVLDVKAPGAPGGRVLIMDNITTEREMIQTQRDFVAMIGHELRTPLTIIKGFAKTLMLRVDKASKEEAVEALETIDGRAAQLERLIEDLLYVSKIETREASLRIEPVDVPLLVNTVAGEVLEDHGNREITIDIAEHYEWACDQTKVALVLRHLVENALKYSEAPSPVRIEATEEDDGLRIDVIDKGPGILSSNIPFIFDRFRQIDGSSTREHGGTGVGLYLAAQLVKVHGGRIWVDSTWGKGSTFSFVLPHRRARGVTQLRSKRAAG